MLQKILVTGANGFIGRRLCSELAQQGHTIRAGVRDEARGAGLPFPMVTIGGIGEAMDWTSALQGVETVIHLAARVHVMRDISADPLEAFRAINVRATAALARAAAAQGVKRLVFVSSIKVNGEATAGRPFSEHEPARPVDPYGISKWEAERALWRVADETGLEVTIVRPPLVYGPGVGGNFLRLLKLVQRGIPLPFGAIENRRSMIYNGNFAYALIACATHANAAGKTYLVSDGEDLSTAELMRRLARALGTSARLLPVPAGILRVGGALTGRAAEIDRMIGSLVIDGSRIRSELCWRPPYSTNDGLTETARWFSSTMS
jgi:nucleoside-diphosphate-sugar epimerase